mgnify:FL=1
MVNQRQNVAFTTAVLVASVHLLVTLIAWLGQAYDVAAGCAVFIPLIVHFISWSNRDRSWLVPSPSLVVAAAYTVFFGAGLIKYWTDDRRLLFRILQIPAQEVAFVVGATAVITSFFVAGASSSRNHSAPVPRAHAFCTLKERPFIAMSFVLCALASAGAGMVVAGFGGLSVAADALGRHDRTTGISIAGTFGSSAWSIFAVPALISASVVAVAFKHRFVGYLGIFAMVSISTIALYIFGSRLTLVLAFAGFAAVYYSLTGRVVSSRVVYAAFAFLLVASSFVVSIRSDDDKFGDLDLLGSLSYAVLDASMAANGHSDELQADFASASRAVTVLSTALPNSSSSALELSEARVDVLVVQKIGNEAQATSSGIPPSLPTFLLIMAGLPLASLLAFGLGLVQSTAANFLFSRRSLFSNLMLGLFTAFVLNSFKGGDLLLDVGSEIRRWVYMAIIYGACWLAFARRQNNKAQGVFHE